MKKCLILFLAIILLGGLMPPEKDETGSEATKMRQKREIKQGLGLMQDSFIIGISPLVIPRQKILATIFAYNAVPEQTDEDYCIAASGIDICEYPDRVIACPAWLEFGTEIRIENEIFICEDRMSKKRRYSRHPAYFDILKPTIQEAKEFGRQENVEVFIY